MLHALLEMEDNDKVPEGGVTSGEDVVSAALALMSEFPAWHMSLGDEKCDILQSAIEDRVEHGGKNDVSANDGAHVGQNTGRPFVHVEFGGVVPTLVRVASNHICLPPRPPQRSADIPSKGRTSFWNVASERSLLAGAMRYW